jgi:predicted 2-oxoglutarate/Fe(II)-dependent dioxygenase YbiX
MPTAGFFDRFGFLVAPRFLDPYTCARLRAAIRASVVAPAEIRVRGAEYTVNESIRKVSWADIGRSQLELVESRLAEIKPLLESRFDVSLSHWQTPQFLVYGVGSFYAPHRDSNAAPDADPVVRERRVSVSIHLNRQSFTPEPETFGGGELTFYGLIGDARARDAGLPLVPEEGLLVAFPSDTWHSVEPVNHGTRYVVVTWYAAPAAEP